MSTEQIDLLRTPDGIRILRVTFTTQPSRCVMYVLVGDSCVVARCTSKWRYYILDLESKMQILDFHKRGKWLKDFVSGQLDATLDAIITDQYEEQVNRCTDLVYFLTQRGR